MTHSDEELSMSLPNKPEVTTDTLAWIALNLVPGIGPMRAHRVAAAFGSPVAACCASAPELIRVRGIDDTLAERLTADDWRQRAEKELERCRRVGVRVLTLDHPEYPELLRAIDFPPPVLYVRGAFTPRDAQALAVVGCRRPTPCGVQAARRLAGDLALAGFTIVSGLARGIDTAAHEAALEAGGRTLAVLAHGADRVYPAENRGLVARLTASGAVVTEFPIGMSPLKENFPRRNRIISGLARGVLVVEAGEASGALITARWALDQGREVFAVPGPFNAPQSQGAHALIQEGAKLTTSLPDLLAELSGAERPASALPAPPPPALSPEQERIRTALNETRGCHVDRLATACGLSMERLVAELVGLELRGWVHAAPGQVYHWTGP
jgi:DNA processing protein